MAQLPELVNVSWYVYLLVAIGLVIIYLFLMYQSLEKFFHLPLYVLL